MLTVLVLLLTVIVRIQILLTVRSPLMKKLKRLLEVTNLNPTQSLKIWRSNLTMAKVLPTTES